VLEHRFTKCSEITQCNGHYAVQCHSRSPVLSKFTRLTDCWPDRQTDRIITARPRLHSMQRDKNLVKIVPAVPQTTDRPMRFDRDTLHP